MSAVLFFIGIFLYQLLFVSLFLKTLDSINVYDSFFLSFFLCFFLCFFVCFFVCLFVSFFLSYKGFFFLQGFFFLSFFFFFLFSRIHFPSFPYSLNVYRHFCLLVCLFVYFFFLSFTPFFRFQFNLSLIGIAVILHNFLYIMQLDFFFVLG